jgi:hypothetical protein
MMLKQKTRKSTKEKTRKTNKKRNDNEVWIKPKLSYNQE